MILYMADNGLKLIKRRHVTPQMTDCISDKMISVIGGKIVGTSYGLNIVFVLKYLYG